MLEIPRQVAEIPVHNRAAGGLCDLHRDRDDAESEGRVILKRPVADAYNLLIGSVYAFQVADALELHPSGYRFILDNTDNERYYRSFGIAKKDGGIRNILAPKRGLRLAQENLGQILDYHMKPKPFVHGYIKKRSFITNADYHIRASWVFTVDVEDFFNTITFPRVLGLFKSSFFRLPHDIAVQLARITTHNGRLPQGAPTSPRIANMILGNLDRELMKIAIRHRLKYSRYADDITFSGTSRRPPTELCQISYLGGGPRELTVSDEVLSAFRAARFAVNESKTRLQLRSERRMVTGLVVNMKRNVRRKRIELLRAKIYALKKHGVESAAKCWVSPTATGETFIRQLEGEMAFVKQVKGLDDPVVIRLVQRYASARPDVPKWMKDTLMLSKEFDLFFSHASEDKPRVRPLVDALKAADIKVFYDEMNIMYGDSLSEVINRGLARSSIFVPNLTPVFADKGWTNKELSGAMSGFVSKRKRIVPIVGGGFVLDDHYPLISDIKRMKWPDDPNDDDAFIAQAVKDFSELLEHIKAGSPATPSPPAPPAP